MSTDKIVEMAVAERWLAYAETEFNQARDAYHNASISIQREDLNALHLMVEYKRETYLRHKDHYDSLAASLRPMPLVQQDEEWRFVIPRGIPDGFERFYFQVHQVSNKGRVRNYKTGQIRGKPQQEKSALYPHYNLAATYAPKKRVQTRAFLHELLMDAFGMTKADSLKIVKALVNKNNWHKQVTDLQSRKHRKPKDRGRFRTIEEVREIRRYFAMGWTAQALAVKYNCDPSTIRKIAKGKMYSNIQ